MREYFWTFINFLSFLTWPFLFLFIFFLQIRILYPCHIDVRFFLHFPLHRLSQIISIPDFLIQLGVVLSIYHMIKGAQLPHHPVGTKIMHKKSFSCSYLPLPCVLHSCIFHYSISAMITEGRNVKVWLTKWLYLLVLQKVYL